ncbi:MupA/Atu3671 family FMN-dependent luciferase-like monooxygenase [Dictyobacter arantiisoli]|uniref:Carrier domain-containing protein n=1 Tax=Dictyobacter arantiisoli TaxID=2014874 RepID=A0A5A5T936_9CHLR|nr:MupA/Atu3671 family FMN-dependent luciferase-like monooxygenase [Dictyobacter arantiisoli]GCF08000.1 hypothetical protein KDI_15640 [Dictyobacter arantiisoli]
MNKQDQQQSTQFSTLVDLLRWRANYYADHRIYTFLVDGETEERHLTYKELDCQARSIARQLQTPKNVGKRALLLYPPGLEYISAYFGCLYAGVIAVPAYPPQSHRSTPRLKAIMADAEVQLILTTTPLVTTINHYFAHEISSSNIEVITTDGENSPHDEDWIEPELDGNTLAFLQYTSGSTASPKGVMISHKNLLHNLATIQQRFEHTTTSIGVIWLPPYHDMGLIGGILQPLYADFPVILMSPYSFMQKPVRWLQAISRYHATSSGGPDFAYDLCIRKVTEDQKATLDLSTWRIAFNGAEPIRNDTLRRFAEAFKTCGFRPEAFYPCYGLAEATLFVTGGNPTTPVTPQYFERTALEQNQVKCVTSGEASGQSLVSCGKCSSNYQIAIIKPDSCTRCLDDGIGEIWISGAGVAKGYWQKAEETRQTFDAFITDTQEGPFLRTGDLGFLYNEELFITGRLKDVIIINGRNHYPQDIELTATHSHPALLANGAAAFSVEHEAGEHLILIHELDRKHRNADPEPIFHAIRQAVMENHDLSIDTIVLTLPGSIPKTSSGKIQRFACRSRFLTQDFKSIASDTLPTQDVALSQPMNEDISIIQDMLRSSTLENRVTLLKTLLHRLIASSLSLPQEKIDENQSFISLGMDSLQAVELQYAIEKHLGIAVALTTLLQSPGISQLAEQLQELLTTTPHPLPIQATHNQQAPIKGTDYPLSAGQKALWFLYRLAPDSAAYHISGVLNVQSHLDISAFKTAMQLLTQRHEALRTTFNTVNGEPVQQIHEQFDPDFQVIDADQWSAELFQQQLHAIIHQPFNLEHNTILRVRLFKRAHQQYAIAFVTHHILSDFWSLSLLLHELGLLYTATAEDKDISLPPLPLRYVDYVYRYNQELANPDTELWHYWQQRLAGDLPTLDIPTDRSRPPTQTYHGNEQRVSLGKKLTQQIKHLGYEHNTTLYMTLLAAFQVYLHRYTGQTDILVGSPVTGRMTADVHDIVGYFTNPLVLRAHLGDDPSFSTFLAQVRQTVLDSLEHQNAAFPTLTERLQVDHNPSRSPLFQVMFVFQQSPFPDTEGLTSLALGQDEVPVTIGTIKATTLAIPQLTAQFDLTLTAAETNDGLGIALRYNTDLFNDNTIERMLRHFQTLLQGIIDNPMQHVSLLPLLNTHEQRQLLHEWNDTYHENATSCCIQHIFEQQVQRTPTAPALHNLSQTLNYEQLNQRANQLAGHLQSLGIGPESIVAVYLERSFEAFIALLGILKAGGAYLPIEPSYPQDRLHFILQDAHVEVVITTQQLQTSLSTTRLSLSCVCLDSDWPVIAQNSTNNSNSSVTVDNAAFVIYTSGSTGTPKGVVGLHRNLYNRFNWMWNAYPFEKHEVCCQKTSLGFVDSLWEMLGPLLQGIPTVILSDEIVKSPSVFMHALLDTGVTRITLVPSLLRALLNNEENLPQLLQHLKLWFSSGEALPHELIQRFVTRLPYATLINLYGSSEVTADVSDQKIRSSADSTAVPIGKPITNTQIYILDRQFQPVPVGVAGEIFVGGANLTRGYLNTTQLTRQLSKNKQPAPEKVHKELAFSLFYFASDNENSADKYRLLIEGAKFADQHGFAAVWTPERHFHEFGGIYPSPSITNAALSTITNTIQLRAGSVVLPLHNPVNIAEEWAVIDNLSHGRVGISFASGWHADDFVLAPQSYKERKEIMMQSIETVRKLWRGESLMIPNGIGKEVNISIYPKPIQPELPIWITAAFNPETFRLAGEIGASVLTHLLGQTPKDLAEKITVYREAWQNSGHSGSGHVTLMLHTFVGDDTAKVRQIVHQPFRNYLKSSADLTRNLARSMDLDMDSKDFTAQHLELLLDHAFERYFNTSGLFGTVNSCLPLVHQLQQSGVDEIACLVDFGIDVDNTLAGLEHLATLKQRANEISAAKDVQNTVTLTAEKYIPHPFSLTPGERLYRTGDLARYHATGEIEYLGRLDYQVKIRGMRIETGEIEALLLKHPSIKQTVVVVQNYQEDKRLIAYVISTPGYTIHTNELRNLLRTYLPEYMMPAAFIVLDQLPLLSNGKIDRHRLPNPKHQDQAETSIYVSPRNEFERMLVSIWRDVLQIDRIGINDNFFDLGGHSLSMVEVHDKIQKLLKRDIPLIEMFKHTTISSLAKYLNQETPIHTNQTIERGERQKQALQRQHQHMRDVAQRRSQRR